MVTGAFTAALSRKSLTIFASVIALGVMALGVVALGPRDASAASVNINSMRVGPPSMGHPFVNSLGGGINAHTDRAGGQGGAGSGWAPRPLSFAECYRRAYLRLEKLDSSMGYEFISATARHICGA